MTVRELTAAWYGHNIEKSNELKCIRNWIYDSTRWHAGSTAWSKELSGEIGKTKFPWEGGGQARQPLSYDAMVPVLNQISKDAD